MLQAASRNEQCTRSLDDFLRLALQEHPDLGACTAHSGMLIAASAVWDDLEKHGILATLLNPLKEDSADKDHSVHSTHSTHSAHFDGSDRHQGSGKKVHDGGSGSSRGSPGTGNANSTAAHTPSLGSRGSPGSGDAEGTAANTSFSGATPQEGAPCKVRARSADDLGEADAGARGPEDVSRKTGQLK